MRQLLLSIQQFNLKWDGGDFLQEYNKFDTHLKTLQK